MEVVYYNSGTSEIIDKYNRQVLKENLEECIRNTSEILTLGVNDELLDEIRSSSAGLEISFDSIVIMNSDILGEKRFNKILIPFTGEHAGSDEYPASTIFIADEGGYITGPMGCENCLPYIKNIRRLLNK